MLAARHAARLLVLGGAALGLGLLLALGFGDEAHAADTAPLIDTTATVTTPVVDTASPQPATVLPRPARTPNRERPAAVGRTDRPPSPPASLTVDKPAPRRPVARVVDTATREVGTATRPVVDQVTATLPTRVRDTVEQLPRTPAPASGLPRVIALPQLHQQPAATTDTRPATATGSARLVKRSPAALPTSPLTYQHPGQGTPAQQPAAPLRAASATLTAATHEQERHGPAGWTPHRGDAGLGSSAPPKPTHAALADVWHPRAPAAHSPPATADALAGRTTRPSPPTG